MQTTNPFPLPRKSQRRIQRHHHRRLRAQLAPLCHLHQPVRPRGRRRQVQIFPTPPPRRGLSLQNQVPRHRSPRACLRRQGNEAYERRSGLGGFAERPEPPTGERGQAEQRVGRGVGLFMKGSGGYGKEHV